MASEATQTPEKPGAKANGQTKPTKGNASRGQTPRVISNPNDVASLVLMQVDAVNAKKDELTIAIKGLADLAKQLVRAYAQNAQVIQKLQARVQGLEKERQK